MFPDKEHARNVVVPLIDELVFGRSVECDFTWTWDRAISRQHCRFYRVGNQVWLEDLGSSRGTWVNGDSIERCLLEGGEVITVGKTPFQAFILRVD
jgi:pSer/pThr/pTyr-binding forkhead associated (FHA) protein